MSLFIVFVMLPVLSLLLAARRNALARLIVGFFDVPASPVLVLLDALQGRHAQHEAACGAIPQMRAAFDSTVNGLRRFTGSVDPDRSIWTGFFLIVPLLTALALLLTFVGDLYAAYLTIVAIFGGTQDALPPDAGLLDWLLALLAMLSLAMLSSVLFDLWNKTPSVTPFHTCDAAVRKKLIWLCLGGIGLLIIGTACAFLWRFLRVEHLTLDVLAAIWILSWGLVLGIVVTLFSWVPAAAVAALHALALLLIRGVLYLVDLIAWLVAIFVDALAGLTVLVLDLLAVASVLWNYLCSFSWAQRIHLSPIVFEPRRHVGLASLTALTVLRSALSSGVPGRQSSSEVSAMATISRTTTILGAGRFATGFLDRICAAATTLHATSYLLAVGRIAPIRAIGGHHKPFARDGVSDITPVATETMNLLARDPQSQLHAESHALADNAIQVAKGAGVEQMQEVWVQDLSVDGALAEEVLHELSLRHPSGTALAITAIPDPDQRDARVLRGIETFSDLHKSGIADTTFLLDRRSPLAQAISPDGQDDALAHAIAGLIRAPGDTDGNRRLADIARSLGRVSPFAGMATVSECVAPGKQLPVYRSLRRLINLPLRSSGDLPDMLAQARKATQRCLVDPTCRAINEHINQNELLYVLYILPLRVSDTRFEQFAKDMGAELANTVPTAIPLFVSGQGHPDLRAPGTYWLQTTVLFPLPDHLRSLDELRRRETPDEDALLRARSNGTPESAAVVLAGAVTES